MTAAEPREPVRRTSPHRVRRPVMTQTWAQMTFLHWRYDPDVVAPFLPSGIAPDVFDGSAWVGLLPFSMRDIRIAGVRAPYLGAFPETNVRTYGVDRDGRRGIVFLSLDAARLVPVAVARAAYRLPYLWSAMDVRADRGTVTYTCRRLVPRSGGASSRITVRVGAPIPDPSPLDVCLTASWRLHVRWWGPTASVPVEHPPWPLRRAEPVELRDQLVVAAGLPAPAGDPYALYSPGVSVRIGSLHRHAHDRAENTRKAAR